MKKFSWDICAFCNFKCDYCFFSQSGWENLEKQQGCARSPQEMEEAWQDIYEKYGSCFIHITGGEPFIYPGFTEICQRLIRYHRLHITTNLSLPVDEFIKEIPSEKAELNCTYHPHYISLEYFYTQLNKLKGAGFNCGVCYLAHPRQLREMLVYKKFFKERGFDMALSVFWGNYNGKNYPENYTEKEKEYFKAVVEWTPEELEDATVISPINRNSEQTESLAPASFQDNFCQAGASYAAIRVDGSVTRCGQIERPVLGNLYRRNVSLLKNAQICIEKYCRCREFQYVSNEF